MKQKIIFRILSVAVILSLLTLSMPATPVLAAKDIEADPTSGRVGDEITITGDDFIASTDSNTGDRWARLFFAEEEADVTDNIDDEVNTYEVLGSALIGLTDASDEGEFEKKITIPAELTDGDDDEDVSSGTYYIYVTITTSSGTSTYIRSVLEFTVIGGEITLDPDKGPVGTEVQISGSDFDGNEDIVIEYDGDEIDIHDGDTDTDSDGDFESTILIPENEAGEYTIKVTGEDSGNEIEATFTVEPEITADPTSGEPGTTVDISGTGFDGRSDITIHFDGDEIDIHDGDTDTDKDGSFESTILIPESEAGEPTIEVIDEEDNTASLDFTVEPEITADPTSGEPGTIVDISGTGFDGSSAITIHFDGDEIDIHGGDTDTDNDGSFESTILIPESEAGELIIEITDEEDNTASLDFTVIITATAGITPVSGHVGTEVTASGTGFTAGETIAVKYDNEEVASATVLSDRTFSAAFDVPASPNGEHTVTISNGTPEQFTFTMESNEPSPPRPLRPLMGETIKGPLTFDWEDVSDDSKPVTYTLQIATDESFVAIALILEKTGLASSQYEIVATDQLASTTGGNLYNWRVRAVDSAGNESLWTGIGQFSYAATAESTSTSPSPSAPIPNPTEEPKDESAPIGGLPPWALYLFFAMGALIIGIIGFWLGRRTVYYSY